MYVESLLDSKTFMRRKCNGDTDIVMAYNQLNSVMLITSKTIGKDKVILINGNVILW